MVHLILPTSVRWMAESESWKPRRYHKEDVSREAAKPTSD